MIEHKPPIGALVRQTYEHRGETVTRKGRVTAFQRWDERKGGEFDQTGEGEGAIVVICEYVDPVREGDFAFGIPNSSVSLIREPSIEFRMATREEREKFDIAGTDQAAIVWLDSEAVGWTDDYGTYRPIRELKNPHSKAIIEGLVQAAFDWYGVES